MIPSGDNTEKLSWLEISGLVALGGLGVIVIRKLAEASKPAAAFVPSPLSSSGIAPKEPTTPAVPTSPPLPPLNLGGGNPLLLQPKGRRQTVAVTASPPEARDLENLRAGDEVLVGITELQLDSEVNLSEGQMRALATLPPGTLGAILVQSIEPGQPVDVVRGLLGAPFNLRVFFSDAAIQSIHRDAEP